MSFDVHILRVPESEENQISADEWLQCIASDPELQRIQPPDSPDGPIIATVSGAEEWETLRWRGGWISASYPQSKMFSKMAAIAQRLGAALTDDDGNVWTMTEGGRLAVDSPPVPPAETSPPTKKLPFPRGIIWPYFNSDPDTFASGLIVWLLSCQPDGDIAGAGRLLSERLQMPLHEATAALRTCQSGQPVGMPAPEDYEEACLLCEALTEFGVNNRGCGVKVSLW